MATVDPSGTALQISTDSAFGTLVLDETTAYRTSRSFVKGDLPYGVQLYARVRHNHPNTGWSKWSNPVSFRIVTPSNVIGVCLNNSNANAKGTVSWIDAVGEQLPMFNWQNHPTYRNIAMATMDSDRAPVTLTRFPLFYVKTAASGPVGTFSAGKKCWWICDTKESGFRPAACFKRSTSRTNGGYVISPYCYMGTFLGHEETVEANDGNGGTVTTTVIGSKRGQVVKASTTKANFKTMIEARNNTADGQQGWRMFDIWDLGALRLLLLIAKADTDTQTAWGDNSEGTAYPLTGSTNARAVFRGTHDDIQVSIEDLWRCYWYHADLITINEGVVTLTSPMDGTSEISFGNAAASRYTQPTTSGWIRDVLDCPFTLGDDVHDLMELFLPGQVVSNENLGTFSDYHTEVVSNPQPHFWLSGSWVTRETVNGIFVDSTNNNASTHRDDRAGSRLSKS